MTLILIAAGIAAFGGGVLGWKLGRGYERLRPVKKEKSSKPKPSSSRR
jgi:hypothetical protein